jgi:predicted phage-related endonuclease
MLHYMMVTGWKKWYLAVLCFGRGFYTFEVERTPEIEKEIEALANIERGFWAEVETKTPPDIDGSEATTEAVSKIFDHSDGFGVDLSVVEIHLRQYESINKQIKQLERLRDEESNRIKVYMSSAEKGSCGAYSVSWKEQERKTFDKKYFEEHYGKIPEDCFKTSTSRPFKFTVKE